MNGHLRSKALLLSRVSTLAIVAAAGVLGTVQQAEAACDTTLNSGAVAGNFTVGSPFTCVVVDGNVSGDAINNSIVGDPGTGFTPFDVQDTVTGSVINNGNISGGYSGAGQRGALTISGAVQSGIFNNGLITSTTGNGIQIGTGGENAGSVDGGIWNNNSISSGTRYGVAALEGTLTGGLNNQSGATLNGGLAAIYIDDSFTSWSGGIQNSGTIAGVNGAIVMGDGGGSSTTFSGGITNNSGGRISSVGGAAIVITNDIATFDGGIANFGQIQGVDDAIRIDTETFSGGVYNEVFASLVASSGNAIESSTDNWSGGFDNRGFISGQDSAFFLLGGEGSNFNGDVLNSGTMTGGEGYGVFIAADNIGGESGLLIRNTGDITAAQTALYVVGDNVNANFTNDSSNPGFVAPGDIVSESGAAVVLAASTLWQGNITNDGTLSGVAGGVIGGLASFSDGFTVSSAGGDFAGSIVNNGYIEGDVAGLVIVGEGFDVATGGLVNNGTIVGGTGGGEFGGPTGGLYISVDTWNGNISNTGLIEGDVRGAYVSANTFTGDIVNDGTIVGGGLNTGLHIDVGTYNGNIVNSQTLSAASNALHVEIGTLNGTITNTGLIEATNSGDTAVRLAIGNGATFVNTGGGIVLGDIVFGGKAVYDFVAEDGGIEGQLRGTGGESGFNDDVVTVQNGTHYFVQGGEGAGVINFAAFNVEAGGTAVMGSRFVGDPNGSPFGFSNVDELNVNAGGQLYLDHEAILNVDEFTQAAGGTTTFFLSAPDGGETSSFAAAVSAASTGVGTLGVHHGQINASGPVTLDGTIAAVLDPLSFAGTSLTQIDYEDVIVGTSLSGDFDADAIFGNSYFYSLSHLIDGNTVDLRLTRARFDSVSCSANNSSYGNALEQLFQGGNLNSDAGSLFTFLSQLDSGSEVCDAYDELGGTVIADLGSIIVEVAGPWKAMVNDRLNGIGSGSCGLAGPGWCFNRFAANETGAGQVMTDATPGDDPFAWLRTGVRRVGETAAWGRLVGVWGDTDGSAGVGGSDFQITGGIVGVDHVFTPILLAGVAAQWTTNDIDFDGRPDNADVDSLELGAYVSWGDTRLYLNANASFIWHDFDVNRVVLGSAVNGDYNGTTVSAYAEAGKIFEAGRWRIQPLVAFSYAHLETDGYTETGPVPATLLIVNGSDFDSLKSMIGARFAYPIQLDSGRKLVPEARVVWAHEFLDDQSNFVAAPVFAPGATFLVQGEEYSRDSIIVGTGISAPLTDQTTIFIDYDAGLNADITTHTVSAGFRTRW